VVAEIFPLLMRDFLAVTVSDASKPTTPDQGRDEHDASSQIVD
jgi:hypothetical protein